MNRNMEFICYFDIRTFVDDYLLIWEPYWLLKERVYLIQFFSMCVFIFQEWKAPRTYVKWVFLQSYLYENPFIIVDRNVKRYTILPYC